MKQNTDDSGWRSFINVCAELETAAAVDDYLQLMLTIEERKDIAGRYRIVEELLKGEKTQREMADDLHVSIAKITRGSNSLKTIGEKLRNFLIDKIK